MRRALASLLLLAACRERTTPTGTGELHVGAAVAPPATRVMYTNSSSSYVDLVNGARHGVVAIRATAPVKSGPAAIYPGAPESAADVALGTGFLVEAQGVFVLTNDHIAAAAPELRVVLPDGTEVAAKLRGRDTRLDLALLALDLTSPATAHLTALQLGSSAGLQVGEPVVVLGDAFGNDVTASAGIVSSTGHDSSGSIVVGGAMTFRTYLQTDARIHRGNSGGPVLDTAGQVVGIAVATGDRPGELSFAIPIDRAREVIPALRDRGTVSRSWLGIRVLPVTEALATTLGLPSRRGALVSELDSADAPAARAGLRPGDVILSWGEQDVDERSLPTKVGATPPGQPIAIGIWRTGALQQVQIVTAPMPQ